MKVTLEHYTPLIIAIRAIRTCWRSGDASDSESGDCIGNKDADLLEKIVKKHKHHSTIEHISYTFRISGISRACLQELARHRIASFSVESTRYTLKKYLKNEQSFFDENGGDRASKYVVLTQDDEVNKSIITSLENLRLLILEGKSNDVAKYALPEALKVNLYFTINARSLRNFLELRTSKTALKEIQNLAWAIVAVLPEEHKKHLFSDILNQD